MFSVKGDPRMLTLALRFGATRKIFDGLNKRFIEDMQREGQKIARHYLDAYVYDVPEPAHSLRTHRTWDEVQPMEIQISATSVKGGLHVDRTAFAGFYYPFVLDRGSHSINYQPRPFWRHTARDLKIVFPKRGTATGALFGQMIVSGVSRKSSL